MQIQTFQIFYDLVQTASFSQVAEMHGITQSAVSQQIRTLEKKFKITLIERGKKNFSVTDEGRAMLAAAADILQAVDSLGKKLQELKTSQVGSIHIAAVHSIGLHELPPLLKSFKSKYTDVEITLEFLRSAQVYQAVLDGRADLGLVAFPAKRRGIDVQSFWKDKLVLICPPSHRHSQREKIRLKDLAGEKLVSFSYDQPTRKAIDRLLAEEEIQIEIAMEFDNIETVKRVVEIESGISIVPRASVKEEVRAGRLKAIEIVGADMWRPLGLLVKKKKPLSHVQKAFIQLLRNAKPNW